MELSSSHDPIDRARLSRRQVVQAGLAAAGGLAVAGGWKPSPGSAVPFSLEPRPIPGGFDINFTPVPVNPFVHVLPPAVGFEMSTITDFDGIVGAAEIRGTAHDRDVEYSFDADMRFMKGRFVGMDGRLHSNYAFAFV